MKKLLLVFILFSSWIIVQAQDIFSDDFESYQVGAFVGVSSTQWTTWSNMKGSAEDVKVVNDLAHSGTNSIKLASTSTSGGPQDLILLFGGRRTVGTFTNEMWVYTPANKGGYFNYQGNVARGTGGIWVMDMFFDANGAVRVTLGTGGASDILKGTHPSAQWFKVKTVANLTENNWEVFIDDVSLGSFSNPNNFITSMDLFPVDNTHSFYVDDISYKYEPYVAPVLDAALTGISTRIKGLTGTQTGVSVKVKNLGSTPITALEIGWSQNGGAPVSQSFTGLNMAYLAERTFVLNDKFTYKNGANQIQVTVTKINDGSDEKQSNNEKTLSVTGVSPAPERMFVTEEATGTWCQWCPRGAVFLDSMARSYPDHFIGIAVHNADPMVVAEYDAGVRSFPGFTGFPSVINDRKNLGDPSAVEGVFYDHIIETTPVKLTNGASYDAATRTLKMEVTGEMLEDVSGDYRFNLVVVENGVKGTTTAYNQVNAYAGGANGPMGGYELLPNPVPASRMTYNHVARAILDTYYGVDGAIPTDLFKGSKYLREYTYTIPTTYKYENIELVGLFIGPGGEIVNATKTTIDEAIANGLSTKTNDPVDITQLVVSPNPAFDVAQLHINLTEASTIDLTLTDLMGRTIASKNYGIMNGSVDLPVQVALLENGTYLLRMKINNKIHASKLVVSH